MEISGWDTCDVILVTGDAYIDHPALAWRLFASYSDLQGLRVGIIAQPDWRDKTEFGRLGKPNLYFGVTSGNVWTPSLAATRQIVACASNNSLYAWRRGRQTT
jgi:hypothetical protein